MNKVVQSMAVFTVGCVSYPLLEILWRGKTHWTMMLAGGICLLLMFEIYSSYRNMSLIKRAFVGAVVITAVEFIFGYIFNYLLNMNIWDYSDKPFNILGQVCLLYTFLWALLSIPVSFLCIKLSDMFERLNESMDRMKNSVNESGEA